MSIFDTIFVIKSTVPFNEQKHPRAKHNQGKYKGGEFVPSTQIEADYSETPYLKDVPPDKLIELRSKTIPATPESKELYDKFVVIKDNPVSLPLSANIPDTIEIIKMEAKYQDLVMAEAEAKKKWEHSADNNPDDGAEHQDLYELYENAGKKVSSITRRIQAARHALRQKAKAESNEAFKLMSSSNHVTLKPVYDLDNARIANATAVVNQLQGAISDTLNIKPFTIETGRRGQRRADYNFAGGMGHVHFTVDNSARTLVHEIGHHVEESNPDIIKATHWLLEERSGEQANKSLRSLTSNRGYRSDEKARADHWTSPYIGKTYGWGSTEVVSMGMEQLFYEPAKLLQDPDLFHFIVNNLRGQTFNTETKQWEPRVKPQVVEKQKTLTPIQSEEGANPISTPTSIKIFDMAENEGADRLEASRVIKPEKYIASVDSVDDLEKKYKDEWQKYNDMRYATPRPESADITMQLDKYQNARNEMDNVKDDIKSFQGRAERVAINITKQSGYAKRFPVSTHNPITNKKTVLPPQTQKFFDTAKALIAIQTATTLNRPPLTVVGARTLKGYQPPQDGHDAMMGVSDKTSLHDMMGMMVKHLILNNQSISNSYQQWGDLKDTTRPNESVEDAVTDTLYNMVFDYKKFIENKDMAHFVLNAVTYGYTFDNGQWHKVEEK